MAKANAMGTYDIKVTSVAAVVCTSAGAVFTFGGEEEEYDEENDDEYRCSPFLGHGEVRLQPMPADVQVRTGMASCATPANRRLKHFEECARRQAQESLRASWLPFDSPAPLGQHATPRTSAPTTPAWSTAAAASRAALSLLASAPATPA